MIIGLKSTENSFLETIQTSLLSPFKEAYKISLKYLNRIIEVIRFCTHRYWLRYLSEAEIKIYEVVLTPGNEKGKCYTDFLSVGNRPVLRVTVIEESSTQLEIRQMLKYEKKVRTSESLLFDAFQYFSYSLFN